MAILSNIDSSIIGNSNSVISNTFSTKYSAGNLISTITGSGSNSTYLSDRDLRVKLTPKNLSILGSAISTNPLTPIINTGGLILEYTPNISIQGSASYSTQTPTHGIQDYKVYQNTPSQSFSISSSVSAQSLSEAKYSAATLHFLRLVTKSRFGKSSSAGLPPPMLILTGYGDFMFDNLPVIVDSYSYQLPDNVDYVNLQLGNLSAKIPTLTTITINVTVQNTPDKLNTFDVGNYANGKLLLAGGWF